MASGSLFLQILVSLALLLFLGIAVLQHYQELKAEKGRRKLIARFRPRPVLDTGGGYWQVQAYKKYTEDRYYVYLVGMNGEKTAMPIDRHRLRQRNIFHGLLGSGPDIYELLPDEREVLYAKQKYENAVESGAASVHKEKMERAIVEAKNEVAERNARVEEQLELLAKAQRGPVQPYPPRRG